MMENWWQPLSAIVSLFVALGALFGWADSRIKAVATQESKSRHDLAGATTATYLELRRDVEELKRETVRHSALREMETRINCDIAELKQDVRAIQQSMNTGFSGLGREIAALTARLNLDARP